MYGLTLVTASYSYTYIQMKVLTWNNDHVVQIFKCKSHENKSAISFVWILTLHVYFVVNKPLFLRRALPSANTMVCSRHVIRIQPIASLASRAIVFHEGLPDC